MAVFTPVTAADLETFLKRYDIGEATSFKGIAEGVQNSNFLLETTRGRYILTLYEDRVETAALPWFLALTTHLADKQLPVPRPIVDRQGVALQRLNDRPACIIEFVPGVSVTDPSVAQSREVGVALGRLHSAVGDFTAERANDLGQSQWRAMAAKCDGRAGSIDPALPALIDTALAATADWPADLPRATVHTDLFPDNVLMLGGRITGLIDFYFACTDLVAYDYMTTHAAWCFSPDGATFHAPRAAALSAGYATGRGLSVAEVAALPLLGQGAALRFVLTRAYDWLNTPADALVTRKDPMAFGRRLAWYAAATPHMVLGR
ncbi:MAG: homoserine kinase [Alphaproteobacteria bacterium]|nr:MAG: homoserine kinase [Alphaproteobacteria bacterium]